MTQNIMMPHEIRQRFIQEHLAEPLKEKCRIRQIEDILGQDEAVFRILNDLRNDRPKNIVLLGPEGTWKKDILRACFKKVQYEGSSFFKDGEFIEYYPEKNYSDDLIYTTLFGRLEEIDCASMKLQRLKIGLVTRANKGILYINNIENVKEYVIFKLVDVLNEKKVKFEKIRISDETPGYLKRFLIEGLPADFCLAINVIDIKSIPEDMLTICDIVSFKKQDKRVLKELIKKTADKGLFYIEDDVCDEIATVAKNGEDAVRILQHVALNALKNGRSKIIKEDLKA
ncbi:sigma 54-interacting transcriptional regulator [Thermoanaerobacterium thermosaccharolyticum]|uniref:sigma 54-interacting transcriptional regulator n=1 Tax=Thermoanaerobacterium thermosaccharolyticum TaxID=1517 RepID=UPI0027A7C83C|nr:sigma 54-interacting transcriptional regulator [Thermoanaerobacterium thermosaccharolyticum]